MPSGEWTDGAFPIRRARIVAARLDTYGPSSPTASTWLRASETRSPPTWCAALRSARAITCSPSRAISTEDCNARAQLRIDAISTVLVVILLMIVVTVDSASQPVVQRLSIRKALLFPDEICAFCDLELRIDVHDILLCNRPSQPIQGGTQIGCRSSDGFANRKSGSAKT
jgi:hypothetical protein